jgi:hypothetical protein
MKTVLVVAIARFLAMTANAADRRQVCTGVPTRDDDGYYLLKPDAGLSLWCDAYISP